MTETTTLRPGSKEAHDAGCTCCQFQNRFGRGWPDKVTGATEYFVAEGCPLHEGSESNA